MKNPTIKAVLPIAILFASSILVSGCGVGEASVADAEEIQAATPVPVEVALPMHTDIFATYAASASISSDSDAPVTARVGGEIVELLVEEGDQVGAGQVLARLDGERLRLEMLAEKANLERARKEYKRNQDLHARGLVSASSFDGFKYDLDALAASYELKRLNYDYSNIRAPIAGIVSSRDVKPGQNLQVGDVAFRITDTVELVAYLQIPQAELSKFQAGHAATVEVAAMPDAKFAATIVRISPTIDARNGTFRATAIIDNSDGELAPGMFGRFTIAYEKHENALVIPSHALLDEDDEQTVYVVSNGEVVRRVVETGIESAGRIEILDGLRDDEQIVVVGHSGLRDGAKVLAHVVDRSSFTG
ncbi:MAG: efflux RND transporter periplasmic adaptor subunit [Gammaproteobacteria bacterium]|nr:efflux RND transporter periplasmic adaptor subunit [Gammaproteobacteria bacterium]